MEFVSIYYEKQRIFAENIINDWQRTLHKKFPNKKFDIELVDNGDSYVIYLSTKRRRKHTKKTKKYNEKMMVRVL